MIKTALTILAVAGTGLFANGEPGAAVATVDGQVIEQRVFDHWITIAAKSSGQTAAVAPDPTTGYRRCVVAKRKAAGARDKVTDAQLTTQCKQEYRQLRDQVMQLLISFKWIQGEATLLDITVTDAELMQSFQEQKGQSFPKDADYQKFLRTSGQTEEDILHRVKLDLLSNKIRDKVTAGKDQVSDQAITEFYADHKSRFATPETRTLRVVLTKTAAEARQARAALERGTSWKAVAKRYSIDSGSKDVGGKIPAVAEGSLERPLEKAVFKAVKHRLVGPIRTQYGYYVFTVTGVVQARQQPLAEAKKSIKVTLASEAEQAALDAFVRDFTTRWKAKTECAAGYRTTDCRNGPAARA